MLQKELAHLLGITPSAVSQLKRQGMPTQSYQAALKWRKRHLEPGRVKGMRADTMNAPKPDPLDVVQRLVALACENFELHGPALDAALAALPDDAAMKVELPESLALRLFADDIRKEIAMLSGGDDHA